MHLHKALKNPSSNLLIIKLILTAIAVYYVFLRIDLSNIYEVILSANFLFFLGAILVFNISKIISAFRLKYFFSVSGLTLNDSFNIKLYYIGMFYNLFLPGSIGGDGYKVYILHQKYDKPVKGLISATLLDRISGLVILVVLSCILFFYSQIPEEFNFLKVIAILGAIFSIPFFFLLIKWFFSSYVKVFLITTLYSFYVQITQILCAWLLLHALSVDNHFTEYLTLFMVSSVAAVLPISIGGIGIREIVFLLGFNYFLISKEIGVAFSILFFSVLAITALAGLLFIIRSYYEKNI